LIDQYKNNILFLKTLNSLDQLVTVYVHDMLFVHVIFFSCAASQTGCASSCTWISSKDHSCRGMQYAQYMLQAIIYLAMFLLFVVI
jgi:hypothetical protein